MVAWNQTDLAFEIIELASEQLEQFKSEIQFYRASIYKHEVGETIKNRVEGLKMIFGFFNHEQIDHAFEDYFDELDCQIMTVEVDAYTSANIRLASCCQKELQVIQNNIQTKRFVSKDFSRRVRTARKTLLGLCGEHSSSKIFFANL